MQRIFTSNLTQCS